MAAPWEPPAQMLPWDRAVLPPPLGLFWTLPKPGCETAALRRLAPEVSLWTVLAAMQAVERKVDVHTGQLRRLERRANLAEQKIFGTEKTLSDFGSHLDALGSLIQAYGQLRKRLDHMEELLKDYSCWALNVPPGARREAPQVPVNFGDVSVYCSEQEWEDLNSGPKAHQKTEESVASMGCTTSKPDSLSPVEGGASLSGEPREYSAEAEDATKDRADTAVLLPTSAPAETEPGKLGQFSPSPGSSEEECVLPFSEEGLVRADSRTAALRRSSETGGDVANFTTIVVQEGVLPGEAPYVCPDCGRSFLYEEQRALHQQSHLRAAPDPVDSPAQRPQPKVRAYTCPDCGRWFPHQASLSKHRLWHTGERPHTCTECKKTFRLKINLHLHERTHTVAKKAGYYICGQCGRTFNHHSNFLRHQMIHTGERPYACRECGKTFIRKEHLATHGRLHTGERPYQCPLCPKSFTRKQHLVGHQRLHEGEAIWLENRPTQRDGQGQAGRIRVPASVVEPLFRPETYPP